MSRKTLILGILAATAAGALAGILMAPGKGSKTRKKILKRGRKKANGIKNDLDDFADSIANKFSKATDEVLQKFDNVKSAATNGK